MIPAAVDAAHEQLEAMGSYVPRKYVEAALEAAAPYIVAETAERIADEMQSWAGPAERGYTQSFAETARQQLPTT